MFCSTKNVRTVSPALTRSTTDSATSAITSRLRVRPPWLPQPVLRPARRASVTSAFEICSAGTRPKSDPGEHRDAEREEQHGHVDRDARLVGHVELRHQRRRSSGSRRRRRATPSDTADEREQHAFGQQLPQQPPASGANRHPDRHLSRSRRAARQLQIGDVGAGDEQQEGDSAEQQLQAGPHLAAGDGDVEVVAQRRREALLRERRRLLAAPADG